VQEADDDQQVLLAVQELVGALFGLSWAYEYPDDATARQALVAPAGLALLVAQDREEQLKDAIVAGLAEHRSADGGYRLRNAFHGLIARAR
jgi:hypothetical protein